MLAYHSAVHSFQIIPAQIREVRQDCQDKGLFEGCRDKIDVIGKLALKTFVLALMAYQLVITISLPFRVCAASLFPALGITLVLDAFQAFMTYIALRTTDTPHSTNAGRHACQFDNVCDLTN
ncbi:MAG: hypothetical protein ACHQUC_05535 [Chlamydiales bacterium]